MVSVLISSLELQLSYFTWKIFVYQFNNIKKTSPLHHIWKPKKKKKSSLILVRNSHALRDVLIIILCKLKIIYRFRFCRVSCKMAIYFQYGNNMRTNKKYYLKIKKSFNWKYKLIFFLFVVFYFWHFQEVCGWFSY